MCGKRIEREFFLSFFLRERERDGGERKKKRREREEGLVFG